MTFYTTHNSQGGAAICLYFSTSSLTVTQCFFHNCTCTLSVDSGGALYVWATRSDCPISVSLSSFTECANTSPGNPRGGSVFLSTKSVLSITSCFFEKSKSGRDGALSLQASPLATLSNCAFVSCSAQKDAGALTLTGVKTIDLSFLQFRECSSGDSKSNDIFFDAIPASLVTEDTVRFCDSTSDRPNVFVKTGSVDMSRLVPELQSTPTASVEVSISEGTATVTATASEGVKGTVGILLNGSNVPRLIHVHFGSITQTSRSGTAVVSSGVNGVLPQADYSLRAWSVPSAYLSSVHSADSTLKDVNTVRIDLHGMNLNNGKYSMLISSGENTFNVSLGRFNSTTLVGSAPLRPLNASGRLDFATEYNVEKVMRLADGGIEENINLINRVSFTTPPEPPRLVRVVRKALNGKKDELIIDVQAELLPVGNGLIQFKLDESEILVNGVLTSDSETECTAVFSTAWTEDTTHLSYGKAYSMESATISSIAVLINPGTVCVVHDPPVITSFSVPTECSSDSFDIEVIGKNFPSSTHFNLTLSNNHNISIYFSSYTKGKGTVKASLPSEVQFGTEYSVSRVWNGYDYVLLNETRLKTPLGPTLTSISASLQSPDMKEVLLSLNGLRMMTGTHTLTFHEQGQSTPLTMTVQINTETTGSGSELIFGGTKLKYGTTYEVISLTSATLHFILADSPTFTTDPEPPRLVKIVSEEDSGLISTTLTLSSLFLTVGGQYEVKMTGTPLSSSSSVKHDTKLIFTANSATANTLTLTLYPLEEADVKYDHSYSVDWMNVVGGVPILVETDKCVFETPSEPSRLVSFWISGYDSTQAEVIFAMDGRALDTSSMFKVGLNFSNTLKHTVSMRFNNERGDWEGSAILFPSESCELEYGKTYAVSSFRKGEDTAELLFEANEVTIDVNPSRLTSVSITGLSDEGKKGLFSVAGKNLVSGWSYQIYVNETGTSVEKTIEVTMSSKEEGTGSAVLFSEIEGEIELDYGTEYKVVGVKDSSQSLILFESNMKFRTDPEPPRLVKIVSEPDEGLNSTTLTLSSLVLTEGKKYQMKVTGTPLSSSSSTTHKTTLKFNATSATVNTVTLKLYPFEEGIVMYGHSYTVDWMKAVDGDPIFIETETCAFETHKEPARILLCTGAVLNKERSEVTISLEGRALGDSLGSIWVKFETTFWKSSSSIRNLSATLCEVDFLVGSEENGTRLKYEGEYTVCVKPDEASTLLVDSGIAVHIPASPSFTKVEFAFTNSLGTGCIAVLTGSDLVVGTEYEVKLNTSHTFSIVVTSSARAESSEMVIGFEGTLAYSQNILVETIEPTVEESGIALMPIPVTGQTPARPNVSEIFVDTETGQIYQTCGDPSSPFSTMDLAWRIVRTLDISQPTFSLLNSTSLSSAMTIECGMSVLIQNGTNIGPSLNIPSLAAESATSALIVVSSAVLSIQNIDVVVGSSNPSFILISALSSKVKERNAELEIVWEDCVDTKKGWESVVP
ncbi:hypothetical protein BLNAU_19398 [Blattamonas nauphoetae]|uniref:Uncharacterized protein n=1 Tax=Blattamonas nauphoetae TaxID=2049346 RepID=A0ABQ9X1N1_9EUKA|nr:hypothetical protein BLNAU_19398 [Blattamonas nauphoetae]